MVNMIKNTINDVFNVEALKNSIKNAIEEIVLTGCSLSMRVCTLVSGASGQYLPLEVAKLFAEDELCLDSGSEFYWDEWDLFQLKINELLAEAVTKYDLLKDNPFNTGYLYLYTNETDGDFVLGFEIAEGTWDFYFRCEECGELIEISEDNLCYYFKGKKYCKEDYENKCLKYYTNACTVGGGFFTTLCEALKISDGGNEKRLHDGFPELVDGYCMWKYKKLKY